MFVRIRDGKRPRRKNVARIGGEVNIKFMPGQTPLSRVDPSVPPVIASIEKDRGKKTVVVEYKDSTDGEVHVVELPPKSLRTQTENVLKIGDQVRLLKRGDGVCPSVGSRGTILGGSGPYTATFEMELNPETGEKLDEVVTITQSHIPRNMLEFEGEAVEDEGDGEEDDSGDEDDSEESDDGDVWGVQNDYYSKSVVLTTLKSKLSPSVYETVIMTLNLEELEELSESLKEKDVDTSNLNSVLGLI